MKGSARRTTSHSSRVKEKLQHVKKSGYSSSKKPSTPKSIQKDISEQTTTVWCRIAIFAMGVELALVTLGEITHDSPMIRISVSGFNYLNKKFVEFCFMQHENTLRVRAQRRRKK